MSAHCECTCGLTGCFSRPRAPRTARAGSQANAGVARAELTPEERYGKYLGDYRLGNIRARKSNADSAVTATKNYQTWSREDDQYLVDSFFEDVTLVAAHLGRTLWSVHSRRSKYRLGTLPHLPSIHSVYPKHFPPTGD